MKRQLVRKIEKSNLAGFFSEVAKTRRVFGPVAVDGGVVLDELPPGSESQWEYGNFALPPKRNFLPQSEVFFTFHADQMDENFAAEEKALFFGLRSCDAASFLMLDRVFLEGEHVDPYYKKRRELGLVITLACDKPEESCFCTSVGGGPASKEATDILACDLGTSLLLEGCTDSGKEFLEEYETLLQKASKSELDTAGKQAATAEAKLKQIPLSGISEELWDAFESPKWDEVSERCLGCGVCSFLCPTCHCFGLYDEKHGGDGKRIRNQDLCMVPGFTLEASGHNPRLDRGQRMRQRIMHKLVYAFDAYSELFCVGCGRCIRNCPVNMDLREHVLEVVK